MNDKSEMHDKKEQRKEAEVAAEARKREDLQTHPDLVFTLLEPDQVVEAKQRTPFGVRRLTRRHRAILWSLRLYVIVMLAIVLVSVVRAVHAPH